MKSAAAEMKKMLYSTEMSLPIKPVRMTAICGTLPLPSFMSITGGIRARAIRMTAETAFESMAPVSVKSDIISPKTPRAAIITAA